MIAAKRQSNLGSMCALLSGAALLTSACGGNSQGGDATTSGSAGIDTGGTSQAGSTNGGAGAGGSTSGGNGGKAGNSGTAGAVAGTGVGGNTSAGSAGKAGSSGAAGSEAGTSGTAGTQSGAGGSGRGGTNAGGRGGGGGSGGGGTNAGGSGGGGNGGGNGGGGTSAGAAGCAMDCSLRGLSCCGSQCLNEDNDIRNCGACGNECAETSPYCDNGTCRTPPCNTTTDCGTGFCCDTQCCAAGQLCCVVPGGPLGPPRCVEPVNGSCPAGCPNCPCASPDTPIATPSGERPISLLRPGDLVYSVDRNAIAAVPIKSVNVNPVVGHHVLRIQLATGVVLEISAMHPTADGRTLAVLEPGGELDGVRVLSVEQIPYAHANTYDILPDSDTGTYYAGGVLIGSTLVGGGR